MSVDAPDAHPRTGRRCRAASGQVLPLVALLLVLVAALALVVVEVGRVVDERARASAAADAAALAGAAEGHGAARELAEANGAVLEELVVEGDETVVTVRVGRARATARAERASSMPPATWRPWPGPTASP